MKEVVVKDNLETDENAIKVLQEFIGLCLTDDTRFEATLWLRGDGGNGKSVFMETIRALLNLSRLFWIWTI